MIKEKSKIIIDTDPGHDDALAILLLEKSGFFDIKAITTVAGNSSIEDTNNNARYILDLISSKTPIYSGEEKPLKKELIKAVVHGNGGLAGAKINKIEKLTNNASLKIINLVKSSPNEITIITLGPLTNIAKAFMEEPEIISMIKEIVIMGGAIEVPGNKNRVAEFNIFVDPDAADIVFRADLKKTLVTLDACNDIFLLLNDFEQIKNPSLSQPIKDMMKPYIEGIQKFEKASGALMYDPLAAYFLINPSAYELIPMDIKVETNSELTRGMTVADRRKWGEKKNNINVVNKINKEAFISDFISILNKKTA